MRALSGAIIAAAALIGLGLTAQGIGTRYAGFTRWGPSPAGDEATKPSLRTSPDVEGSHVKIRDMDNGLKLSLTLSAVSLLVGLGITFVGLMYHHHRRYHEHLRTYGQPGAEPHHHAHT